MHDHLTVRYTKGTEWNARSPFCFPGMHHTWHFTGNRHSKTSVNIQLTLHRKHSIHSLYKVSWMPVLSSVFCELHTSNVQSKIDATTALSNKLTTGRKYYVLFSFFFFFLHNDAVYAYDSAGRDGAVTQVVAEQELLWTISSGRCRCSGSRG